MADPELKTLVESGLTPFTPDRIAYGNSPFQPWSNIAKHPNAYKALIEPNVLAKIRKEYDEDLLDNVIDSIISKPTPSLPLSVVTWAKQPLKRAIKLKDSDPEWGLKETQRLDNAVKLNEDKLKWYNDKLNSTEDAVERRSLEFMISGTTKGLKATEAKLKKLVDILYKASEDGQSYGPLSQQQYDEAIYPEKNSLLSKKGTPRAGVLQAYRALRGGKFDAKGNLVTLTPDSYVDIPNELKPLLFNNKYIKYDTSSGVHMATPKFLKVADPQYKQYNKQFNDMLQAISNDLDSGREFTDAEGNAYDNAAVKSTLDDTVVKNRIATLLGPNAIKGLMQSPNRVRTFKDIADFVTDDWYSYNQRTDVPTPQGAQSLNQLYQNEDPATGRTAGVIRRLRQIRAERDRRIAEERGFAMLPALPGEHTWATTVRSFEAAHPDKAHEAYSYSADVKSAIPKDSPWRLAATRKDLLDRTTHHTICVGMPTMGYHGKIADKKGLIFFRGEHNDTSPDSQTGEIMLDVDNNGVIKGAKIVQVKRVRNQSVDPSEYEELGTIRTNLLGKRVNDIPQIVEGAGAGVDYKEDVNGDAQPDIDVEEEEPEPEADDFDEEQFASGGYVNGLSSRQKMQQHVYGLISKGNTKPKQQRIVSAIHRSF